MLRSIDRTKFFNLADINSKIKFLLQYAILAPSTHNSQPWLFKIKDGFCHIYADSSIKIVKGDPLRRDLFISLGCCLENLLMAANAYQLKYSLKLISDDFSKPVCSVEFFNSNSNSILKKNLLDAIEKRKNARGTFLPDKVPINLMDQCAKISNEYHNVSLNFVTNQKEIEHIAFLTGQALKLAYNDSEFRKEMATWINASNSKKKRGIPGFALKMPFIASLILPKIIPYFNLGPILSKLNYKALSSAPLISIISGKTNDYTTWFEVGRLAQRLMVYLCLNGYYSSVYVAAIEMGNYTASIKQVINSSVPPQFLFAVGKIKVDNKFTPRLPLKSFILE